MLALAGQLQSWVASVLGEMVTAAELSLWMAKNKVKTPVAKCAIGRAQTLLRNLSS